MSRIALLGSSVAAVVAVLVLTACPAHVPLGPELGAPRAVASSSGPAASSSAPAASSSSSPAPLASVDTPECNDVASATCARIDACAPWRIRRTYGDRATCERRVAADCAAKADGERWYAQQAGMPAPPVGARRTSCAKSIAAASCDDFEDQVYANECDPLPGKAPDGALCASGKECQSAHCSEASADADAVCVRVAAIGGACSSLGGAQCDSGAMCIAGKCVRFGGEGAECGDGDGPCAGFLTCFDGKCAKPTAVGAKCGDDYPACIDEGDDAVACTNGVCTVIQFAKAGEPCDMTAGPFCEAGGFCQGDLVDAAGKLTYTGSHKCVAAATDNNACDSLKGPMCMSPATCDEESNICLPPQYTAMMTRLGP
jgi:hypothetical protein